MFNEVWTLKNERKNASVSVRVIHNAFQQNKVDNYLGFIYDDYVQLN